MFASLNHSVESAKKNLVVDAVLARMNLRTLSRRHHERIAPPQRRKILFETLEPRLLLSADLLPGAVAQQGAGVTDISANLQVQSDTGTPQINWSAQFDASLYTNALVADFDVDNFTSPLAPVSPNGGLVYAGGVRGTLDFEGDSDVLSIDLDGGQTFTLRFKPNADLQAGIEAFDPYGNSLGLLEAANPGDSLILQVRAAADAGTYSIGVNGLAGAGAYSVEIFLNAAVEEGDTSGFADAQSLDEAFSYLLDSDALRGAVVGDMSAALPTRSLAQEDFQDGDAFWSNVSDGVWTLSLDNIDAYIGRDEMYEGYGGAIDAYLVMRGDQSYDYHEELIDDGEGGTYTQGYFSYDPALTEATWKVDLAGATKAILSFEQWGYDETGDGYWGDFYGFANFDGVAVSVDGDHWFTIENLGALYDYGDRPVYEIDLVQAAANWGVTLGPDTYIRFQQYDAGGEYTYERSVSYRNWDNIRVTTDQQQILLTPAGISASGAQDSEYFNGLDLLSDGFVPVEQAEWDADSNIYWWGQEIPDVVAEGEFAASAGTLSGLYFDIDLGSEQRVADLVLSVDNNDDYAVDYSTDGDNWTRLIQIRSWYGEEGVGSGMDTFSTWDQSPDYDANLEFTPVQARYLRIYATGGDGGYAIGEVQAYADAVSDQEDWYSLTLDEGELASLTLSHENPSVGNSLALELYDQDHNLMALGLSVGGQVTKAIENLRAPYTGTYFLRVLGAASGEYNLVAVRQAQFGPATKETQDLTLTPIVLDALSGASTDLRVAVVNSNGYLTGQLSDNTYYNFNVVSVGSSQVDSLEELSQYDVVVLGEYIDQNSIFMMAPALRQWVEQGHGLVTTGWMLYYGSLQYGNVSPDLDAVVPINLNTYTGYTYNYAPVAIDDASHPVTEGVTEFTSSYTYGYLVYGQDGVDAGATVLGSVYGWPAIVVGTPGAGRTVALSPDYDNSGYWTSGMADRVLEQAVAWAAAPVNQYTVEALAGTDLSVSLDLIGADAGQPANDFEPVLELYDTEGNLLAEGGTFVSYSVEAEARFVIKVKGAGTGDYLLRVGGDLPDNASPLAVMASNLDGLDVMTGFPDYVDLTFSAPVLFTSLDNFDLSVNGASADSYQILSPNQVRFWFESAFAGDGDYALILSADGVTDIHGNSSQEWALNFALDSSGPQVVDTNVAQGATLSAGVQTLTFTFNEGLSTEYLDETDVQLLDTLSGQAVPISDFGYDADTRTLTVATAPLGEGAYVLTLFSGYYGFKDIPGNYLDGNQDGANGDNYDLSFSVDITTMAYPPMQALPPLGSLVYDPLVEGVIQTEGDVDAYTVSLDEGQVLTVVAAVNSPDLQLELAVIDADDDSQVAVLQGNVGEGVVLQALSGLSGEYRIEVRGVAGTGRYDFALVLNALLEEEMLNGVPANDSIDTALSLESGNIEVGSWGGERMAVLGDRLAGTTFDQPVRFESNGHYYEVVYMDGLGWSDALSLAESRTFRGRAGTLATVTSLAENQFLTAAFGDGLMGLYLGAYQPEDAVEPGGGWAWHTGESFSFNNWAAGEPNDIGGEDYLTFDHGIDAQGMQWNDASSARGFVVEYDAPQLDDDYYSFHLAAGQAASVALAWADGTSGELRLELLAADGTVLVLGAMDASNAQQAIHDFVAPGEGDYILRVSGADTGLYNLVVTRGLSFSLPGNQTGAAPQDISLTGQVLGYAGGASGTVGGGGGVSTGLSVNLYDSSGYRWDIQGDGDINDGSNDAYDGGLYHTGFPYFSSGLSEDGGREIVIGPATVGGVQVTRKIYVPADQSYARFLEIVTNTSDSAMNYTVPIRTNLGSDSGTYVIGTSSGDLVFDASDRWIVTDDSSDGGNDPTLLHVLYGEGGAGPASVSRTGDNLYYNYALSLAPGETRIVMHFASQNPNRATALAKAPQLDDLEMGALDGMSSAEKSAVVNFKVGVSEFTIQVMEGDELEISTATPGSGPGEPANTLNPSIELLDPNGVVVASDTDGAGDGRNAFLTYTAAASGMYTVRVLDESGTQGDFLLHVSGATGAQPGFTVTGASIGEGQILSVVPTTVDVDFSSALRVDSIQADDLRVNGQAAVGVLQVDADTLRFDISGLITSDGVYTLEIQSAALTGANGADNDAFSRNFIFDAISPTVTASSIAENESVASGARTLVFTLSETLASTGLGAEDVLLANSANGVSYTPASFVYDAANNQVTVQYASLPEGAYTLTLISGANSFRDLVGNALNGDTSDADADNYVLHFNVDDPTSALPALTTMAPLGSLVYQAEAAGRAVHATGDVDAFTVSLDAGQTLTLWATPTAGSPRLAIELFDAETGGSSLGLTEASASSQIVLLQTLAISGGTYRVEVRSLEGEGQYTLKALLNAAVETELLSGASNDTLADAQDLSASLITTGSDRAAVVGRLNPTPASNLVSYNGHYYELVTSTLPWANARAAAETRSYLGATGHLVTLETVEESRFLDTAFSGTLSGAWMGAYQPSGSSEPDGGWTWVTGQPVTFTNWGSGEPNNSGGVENAAQFRSDSDTEGRLWNDANNSSYLNYLVEYEPVAANDWYSIHLDEGQKASFVLTPDAGLGTKDLWLGLYDAGGNLLTAGSDIANNVDEAIMDFAAPAGGDYYLRVSGSAPGLYSLVATRDQTFSLELGDAAQDISPTGEVLGALGTGNVGNGLVAVVAADSQNDGLQAIVNQINDHNYANTSAVLVSVSDVDTLAELSQYSAIIIGGTGYTSSQFNAFASNLRAYVEAGGGLLVTGWGIYASGGLSGQADIDFDAIVPVNTNSYSYISGTNTIVPVGGHAIVEGVTSFSASPYIEYPANSPQVDTGATVLAYVGSTPVAAVANIGSGRSVYLGPVYAGGSSYDTTNLRGGEADQLLEQAVAWAAGDGVDEYLIQVVAGDELAITSTTPLDGDGLPINHLDVRVELYDETGQLVAHDENGAADGRNVSLHYTALSGGAYKIRVLGETGSGHGEYVLRVSGATGAGNAAPYVIATDPADGKRLNTLPASVTLDLSESLLASSLGVEDFSIDGGATVTGVEMLDGDSVRLLLDVPDVEGTYHYTLLADSLTDLQGMGNLAYSGSFIIDKTGPRVVSQIPEVQNVSPFSTWSVTFNEALNPATVQTSDFVLRNPSNSAISISTATLSNDGLTVTLTFAGQYTQGNYTLTVGPEIYDVAGNRMDQDAGTAGNQAYVGTVQVASPDLSPVSISITMADGSALPEGGVPLGSQVHVTWTVRNVGTDAARASAWYDSLWISTDTNTAGDTLLADVYVDVDPSNVNGLPAGGTYTMEANVTLPLNDSFGAGTYYIRVQTDNYNYQPENNEANNTLFSGALTTVVPPLPDLTVSDVTVPAVIEAGKDVTVNWTVHNQGTANAGGTGGYWYDRVVLSTDQIFGNGDDVYLNQINYNDGISAGGELARSATVNVWSGSTGTWYVLVKTDYYNSVYERANEGNNVGVSSVDGSPVQVQVIVPTEDLTPVALDAPDAALFDARIDASWTVRNDGTGPTYGNWYDRLWLSTDTTRSGDDIQLTYVYASESPDVRPVAAGEEYTRSIQGIHLPLSVNLPEGAYYLLLETDSGANEPELNENNNVIAKAIQLSLADYADLTVSDVIVPSEPVHSGETVTVSFTLHNEGEGAAASFHNRVYLSSDGTSLDYQVGDYFYNQTLAAGESETLEKAITIPLYSPGDWYVVVLADSDNNIYEHANEGNNRAASSAAIVSTLPPLPDLVVSNIVAPLDALAGEAITISWTITNQGQALSGAWVDTLYLSTNGGASNSIPLGNFAFEGTLAAGASVTRTQTFTLSPTQEGPRTVVIYTDAGGQVNETPLGESNNRVVDDTTITVTFPPLPNLRVTSLTPPSDPASGTQTEVSWVVANTGTGATSAAYWYDQVHLSLNTVWGDGDDINLGTALNPGYLAAGENYQSNMTIAIPKGLNGDYYFLVMTDVYNHVFEDQNEGDNVFVSPLTHIDLTPPPDLRVDSVEAQNLAFSGQNMTVAWTVSNHGEGRTVETGWYDRVVMSEDDVLGNADDRNMGDFWHVGALDPDEAYSVTKSISLPVGVVGDFYFFVITDRSNLVYEHGSEFNNTAMDMLPDGTGPETTTIQLTPPPDLEVFSLSAPANAEAGHSYNAYWRVVNYGATATPNNYWVDRLYLSTDDVLDAGDISLGERGHWGVLGVYDEDAEGNPVSGYYDNGASFTLPYDISGAYHLIVKTDVYNNVFEGFDNPTGPDGEDNNASSSSVMNVLSHPADLVVDSFTASASGEAGKQISVTWTVRNAGSGDTVSNAWFDQIVISADDILGDADDVVLQNFGRGGLLNAGDSYTRTEAVTLPFSLESGDYRIFVRADINNNVHESSDANNSAAADIAVSRETPDLRIVSLGHEATGMVALPLDVSWRVENLGANQTNVGNWYDDVFLSLDQVLDGNDIFLGQRYRNAGLAIGEGYDASTSFSLPTNLAPNDYYIIVRTDKNNGVVEGAVGEGNNVRASEDTVHVVAFDPNNPDGVLPYELLRPDLTVTSVEAPDEVVSGQTMQVSWTVINDGPDQTGNRSWYDAVYLSRDGVLDRNADMYLGYAYHANLAVGESYTQTLDVTVPYGQSGPFYVFVATDAGRYITEADELNNVGQDAAFTQVSLAPPADLVVGEITVPANGIPGTQATISFSVENQGVNPALGAWNDSIYLSADDTWDITDPLFGVTTHYGNVDGGSSYSNSLTATLPGLTPGNYKVIIRSDIRNHIPESNESNNIGASLDAVTLDVEALTLGAPDTGHLGSGQAVYYKFTVGEGETVRLLLDSLGSDIANELYVRYGSMPTRGQFDIAAREGFVADPELVIPTTQAGTYYVLAYGQYAPGNPQYSITAQVIPFSITSVNADVVGNAGDVTLRIDGAKFDADTRFSLVAPDGGVITAKARYLENSSEVYATFGLFEAELGAYDVVAEQPDGAKTTLADALEVIADYDAGVFMSIAGPTQVMVSRTNIFTLDYVNDGGADAMAPLMILESFSATPMGLSASDLHTTPIQIMAASYDGPMDILRPGARYSVPIVFQSAAFASQLDIRVGRIMADDVRLIEDWDAIEASIRPDSIPSDEWDAFWGRIKPLIGPTWGEYVQVLDNMMVQVSDPGAPIHDVREIFARMYLQNPNFVPYSSMSGEVRDSEADTPLADIQMAAYLVHDDGHLEYKASAISDADGQFTFARLVPGEYTVVAIGRALDMDRDGQVDLTTPDVTLGDTEPGDAGVIYIQPVGGGVDDDSNPALTRDANGITHMVWNRDGQVWHSWFDASTGQWRDAAAISTGQSYAPTISSSAYLLDGVNAGLLVAWQQGGGNDAEIWFAVGRAKSGGGFEWSAPVQLTDDDTADISPEIIIGDTGVAMITHLKRDDAIQDDADIYYDLLGLSASQFIWPSATVDSADAALATEGVSVAYGAQWKFGPWDFFGTKAEIALALSGQVGENNCTATLGATGQLSGSFTGGSIRSTISGSGTVGAEWTVNEAARDWLFNRATAGWSAGAQFDWRYGLSTVLSKIPHPAVTAAYASYRGAVAIASYLGLDFEDGITFGGSASFTGMEWKFAEPFPAFVWPESIAEASISGLIGVYAQLDAATGDSARLQGDLTVTVDIAPAVQLKSVTGNITLSGNIGWWTFNEVFTVNFYQADAALLDAPIESQDTSGPVFNPDALIGTGNVYEGTALLGAGVSSDVTADSAVTLANDAGVIFGAWTHMADPHAGIGDQVMVSEFGSGWSTPVALAGSLGINADATAAVDGLGNRMVVWSHADSGGLGSNPSFDDFRAASDAADIVYAIYDEVNGSWSSPVAVSATLGRDDNIEVTHDAAGNLVMTWIVEGGEGGLDRLMSATWDGGAWSAAVEIATGASIGDPAIERLGDNIIVVWEENAAAEQGNTENTLHYALYEEAAWSAGAVFDPIAMATGLALSAGQPATAAADTGLQTESVFPPFPVPEECLKCKPEDIKRIRESAPECIPGGGTQVSFDPKTCTEKTIVYKPCVVRPRDPNDIIGPSGFGDEKWVAAKNSMGYTIRFENAADASAPAQQVVVTQQLDDDLDWRTFRVDDFGFGDQIIELDGKSAFYQARLDYTADPERGYYLDVSAAIDVSTGIVTWTLTTIDPATGELPQDASIGFLPINDTVYDADHNVVEQGTGRGEGYVSYSVKAKRDVETGAVVDAEARIVFDTEEPIDTPAIFNTLDAGVPESHVLAFADSTTALGEFLVSWVGVDDEAGSGVRDYTVYVSVDGGAFSIWQADTDLTEAIYIGSTGHTYSFYSTVRDNAGNEEAEADSADATITVAGGVGALSGVKYEDMDGDGARDEGEMGLAGWTIFLDANDNGVLDEGELSTVTGEDGGYGFTDLAPGEYIVREVMQAGWMRTSLSGDAGISATVVSDETTAGVDFGNFELAQIGGLKFDDLNANGVRDEGESGLAGWVIQLDKDGDGGIDASATTDEYGYYRFTDLGPGSYRISEVMQEGWLQTGPSGGGHTAATTSGADIGGMDFANVEAASISGVKFEDMDGDGQRDDGESGLAGWTIFLDANGNGGLDVGERSVVTDENGAYRFDNLLPGAYVVAEVMQSGWTQTSPGVGPSGVTSTSLTLSGMDVVLSLPEDVLVEEGLTTQSISANELADALVGLDAFRGDARFAGIDGSGVTTVVIDTGIDLNHAWFGPDADNNGVADRIVYSWDFADGDADASDHNGHGSHVASLIGGQDATYGGVATGADLIALKVFSDDGSGYFSYLEQALQWVVDNADDFHVGVVNLSLGDGGNWDTAIGRYGLGDELAALASMNIIVTAAAGNNYFQFDGDMGVSYPAADPAVLGVGAIWSGSFGGPVNYANGAIDYDTGADRLAAFSQRDDALLDVLAPGTRLVGANYNGGTRTMFGTSQASAYMAGVATLAQDLALDHLGRRLSLGEFSSLLASTSVQVNDGDDELDNVTNTGLSFARVDILALAEGILALEGESAPTDGGSTVDNGATHPLGAPGVHQIVLVAGEDRADADFGNFALGSLSGTVYHDLDADGARASGESALDGWTVFLDANADGLLDLGEQSTLTGLDGEYRFDDVGPGTYRITLLGRDGWTPSTDSFFDVFMTSGLDAGADFGVNAKPTLDAIGDVDVDEGGMVAFSAAGHDDAGDSLSYILVGDTHGASLDAETGLFSWNALDGDASETFTIRVTDSAGGMAERGFTVTVHNVAPVLNLSGPASVTDDQDFVLGLSASDPGMDTIAGWTVDWGDGSGSLLGADSGNLSHRYALPGDYTVNVSASDEDGGYSASTTVSVLPGTLKVTSLEATNTGFKVKFNRAYVPELLNLYDSAAYNRGAPDIVFKTASGAAVAGSAVLDADHMGLTFVKTNGLLANGAYSLTLDSRADAFVDSDGGLLDGNRDGVAGDKFSASFTISGSGAVMSIGEFSRGPGQSVDVPATSAGVPILLTGATGARQAAFTLAYDPDLLNITSVTGGAGIPAGSTVSVDFSVAGQVRVTVQLSAALGAGSVELVKLVANVPATAPYGAKQVLDLKDILLDTGAAVRDDDGLHLAAYVGDTTGNAKYSTLDVQRIQRTVVRLDTGFGAYPLVDPTVIGDVSGNNALTSLDAQRLLSEVMGIDRPEIPPIPKGMTLTFSGADPVVSISSVDAKPGDTVVVPVNLDTAAGLESVELTLVYPADNLELIDARLGGLTRDFDYFVKDVSVAGRVVIDMSRLNAMTGGAGSLLELEFKVGANANADLAIDLQYAALNDTWLTLNPAPKPGVDSTDGVIKIKSPEVPTINFASWATDFNLGLDTQNTWVDQWLSDTQPQAVTRKLNSWKLSVPSVSAGAKV